MNTLKSPRIFYPIAVIIFLLPYLIPWPYLAPQSQYSYAAWGFTLATFGLIGCAYFFYKGKASEILGLAVNRRQLFFCGIVGLLVLPLFYFLIQWSLESNGYKFVPHWVLATQSVMTLLLIRITQPLNEEIVLRAFLLGILARFFSNRLLLAILAALVFSSLHYVLYHYGLWQGELKLTTLVTLFSFSLAANALFLTFGHIGYGYVIHFAWNFWRFSGLLFKDGAEISEAQSFNILEGSTVIMIFVIILSLICVVGLEVHEYRRRRKIIE